MNKRSLNLRHQNLLALSRSIILIQSIRLNHSIKLRTSCQDRRNGRDDSNHIAEITQNGECAQVFGICNEWEVRGEVEGHAIDEIESVSHAEEGKGKMDCCWVGWVAGVC